MHCTMIKQRKLLKKKKQQQTCTVLARGPKTEYVPSRGENKHSLVLQIVLVNFLHECSRREGTRAPVGN